MSLAENIKKRRLELGMSQQELADAMGYKSRSTIAKIEAGENTVPRKKIKKFAAILDTTEEYIKNDGLATVSIGLTGATGKEKREQMKSGLLLLSSRVENQPVIFKIYPISL